MKDFRGIIVVVPTPFDHEGQIDDESLERLIDHYLSLGVQGLTIMGVMGEGSKLTASESRHLMQRIFALVGGRLPVIVGASNPNDDACVAIGHEAMSLGAAGVMISPAPGLAGGAAVADYFAKLCDRFGPDVPICVQDYPAASGVKISAEGLAQIFEALPQLGMVKLEDMPNLDKLTELLGLFSTGRQPRPAVFVGNNSLYADLELARGADGIMSGFALPEVLLRIFELQRRGDLDGVAAVFQKYLPLIRYEAQPGLGLAARKYVLQTIGLLNSTTLRRPGYELTQEHRTEIDRMLMRLDRKPGGN